MKLVRLTDNNDSSPMWSSGSPSSPNSAQTGDRSIRLPSEGRSCELGDAHSIHPRCRSIGHSWASHSLRWTRSKVRATWSTTGATWSRTIDTSKACVKKLQECQGLEPIRHSKKPTRIWGWEDGKGRGGVGGGEGIHRVFTMSSCYPRASTG